ncbi:MAG: alpha/beta fold hydrolase [Truepera sp.]|nr:alpha/beta fold hydrolase [Truepera sp.]
MARTTALQTVLLTLVLAVLSTLASAQEVYSDPAGRFQVPVPTGWTDESTPQYAKFTRSDPAGLAYVLAAPGKDLQVVLAALQTHIDATLDESFVAAPLQASPVPLPSGTWIQRIYLYGEELLAAISLEQDGLTYLILLRGTQATFMQAINAAANQLLLGFEIPTAAEPEEDLPYRVQEVTFTSDGITLAGTLTIPEADGRHPAIILISGSGAQDRNGANPAIPGYQPLRWLANHLTRQGVAVLRFDERGVGESGGDHALATSLDFASDTLAAMRYLQGRDDIDPAQIGLLGHSEGAMIAAMAAARNPEVAFVIAMAGAAVPGYEVLLVQLERIMQAAGTSEEEIMAAKAEQQTALALAVAGDWEAVESTIYDALLRHFQGLPEEQLAILGDLEAVARAGTAAQLEALQSPWFQLFLSYDPAQDYRQITAPVLALFGGLDTQVDAAQNRPALEVALAEAGNEDVTVVVFEQANHLFQEAVTGSPDEYLTLEMAFLPGFLETISDWLLKRVR